MYKIFIADDDRVGRKTLIDAISSEYPDADIREAINGQDLVDLVLGEKPSLVLTDNEMPVMDGITAIERIRAIYGENSLPIIMISGRKEARVAAYEAGASAFLERPFNLDKLYDTIEKYMSVERAA